MTLPPHAAWRLPAELAWNENPFREINWTAQLHMLRWIDPLRRRADTGDLRGVDLWVRTVRSWIAANPPGRGRAQYAWGDMVEAVRAMVMCFGLPMLRDHAPDHLDAVLASVTEHGEWLADPARIRIGNHALQQHQGLLVIGAVLERDAWVDLAIERMVTMLRSAYDEDGINEEGAVQYHQINYSWWSLTKRRVELVRGRAPDEFSRIDKAPVGLAHATRPDGTYELIGDTEVYSLRGIPHPAVTWVATGGDAGAPPPERVKVYGSGYVFGRSGWGDAQRPFSQQGYYTLRFGPQNRIHGHEDGAALTFYHRGRSVLVDGGKYAYDAKDPLRAHLLSRPAHNAVHLRGEAYDRTTSVELTRSTLREHGEDFEFVDRGYAGAVLRRRVVVMWDLEAVIVTDDVESDHDTEAVQVWHLDPSAGHRVEAGTVLALQRDEGSLHTWFSSLQGGTSLSVVRGRRDPWQGWTSPRWRERVETRTIEISATGRSLRLSTLIDLSDRPTRPSVEVVTVPSCRAADPSAVDAAGAVDEVDVVRWSTTDGVVRSVALGADWFVTDRRGTSAEDVARLGRDSFGR
nr:heparinase II/III family protein [Terrabacter sp. MAHUQ-38]